MIFLRGLEKTRATDAAAVPGLTQATLSRTVTTLVRKHCVTKRRSVRMIVSCICCSVGGMKRSPYKSSSGYAKW
jgi:hypothetical protein